VKSIHRAILVVSVGIFALLITVYAAARLGRSDDRNILGRISEHDGPAELYDNDAQRSQGLSQGDQITTNRSVIKTGPGSMTKISSLLGTIVIGPDSSARFSGDADAVTVRLDSGELIVRRGTNSGVIAITSTAGEVQLLSPSNMIISRPAGQSFAVIEVSEGEVSLSGSSKPHLTLTPINTPHLLSTTSQSAIWIKTPPPEEVFFAKEGFAAVEFSWQSNISSDNANLLIRDLKTGELSIHEATKGTNHVTLAAGTYAWSVNTGGIISAPRRFHIKGASGETDPQLAKSTLTSTKDGPELSASQNSLKPQSEKSPEFDKPSLKIVEPASGAKVPVDFVADQRIQWTTKGQVDSIDLEIFGSSGNPVKQYTLEGDRTRRRLPALPPGRYTVRVRANGIRGDDTASSPWAETFFDVVQTESGQLAPSDIKVSKSMKGDVPYLLIEWSRSQAPRYQVTVRASDAAVKVARTTKSQVLLNMPENPIQDIEVCALDANLQVRGCAPKVEDPDL
jgi:hypothetical protein